MLHECRIHVYAIIGCVAPGLLYLHCKQSVARCRDHTRLKSKVRPPLLMIMAADIWSADVANVMKTGEPYMYANSIHSYVSRVEVRGKQQCRVELGRAWVEIGRKQQCRVEVGRRPFSAMVCLHYSLVRVRASLQTRARFFNACTCTVNATSVQRIVYLRIRSNYLKLRDISIWRPWSLRICMEFNGTTACFQMNAESYSAVG